MGERCFKDVVLFEWQEYIPKNTHTTQRSSSRDAIVICNDGCVFFSGVLLRMERDTRTEPNTTATVPRREWRRKGEERERERERKKRAPETRKANIQFDTETDKMFNERAGLHRRRHRLDGHLMEVLQCTARGQLVVRGEAVEGTIVAAAAATPMAVMSAQTERAKMTESC